MFSRVGIFNSNNWSVNTIQQISISKSHQILRIQTSIAKLHTQRIVWRDRRNADSSLAQCVICQSQVRQFVLVSIMCFQAFLPALSWQLNRHLIMGNSWNLIRFLGGQSRVEGLRIVSTIVPLSYAPKRTGCENWWVQVG